MPLILETIVTTTSPSGDLHLVPFGLICEGEDWVLAPFRPSPTILNLEANPVFAASSPSDVRVIAGAVTGRRDWATLPCDRIPGRRLAESFGHAEFEVISVEDDATRPRYRARMVHSASHMPFFGYNRAQGAVLEAAILSTRLHMLEPGQDPDGDALPRHRDIQDSRARRARGLGLDRGQGRRCPRARRTGSRTSPPSTLEGAFPRRQG